MSGTARDPLLDPRTGDIVADAQGAVLEVVDVILGRGACVAVREDSSRYRVEHDEWRAITAGGRVIHAARARDPLTDPCAGDVVADVRGHEMTIIDASEHTVWWRETWGAEALTYSAPVARYRELVKGGRVIHAVGGPQRDPLLDPRAGDVVADAHGAEVEVLQWNAEHKVAQLRVIVQAKASPTYLWPPKSWRTLDGWRKIVAGGRVIHAAPAGDVLAALTAESGGEFKTFLAHEQTGSILVLDLCVTYAPAASLRLAETIVRQRGWSVRMMTDESGLITGTVGHRYLSLRAPRRNLRHP